MPDQAVDRIRPYQALARNSCLPDHGRCIVSAADQAGSDAATCSAEGVDYRIRIAMVSPLPLLLLTQERVQQCLRTL